MKEINNSNLYIISEKEIQFKNKTAKRARSACPACGPNRTHPNDPSVAWDLAAGVGYCHRCNARFKIDNNPEHFMNSYGTPHAKKETVSKSTEIVSHLLPLEPETADYLKFRGIDDDVARKAGICSRQTWKGTSWMHWVAFPFYNEKGRVVNVQYKLADCNNKQFMFEYGGEMIPWNICCIIDKPDEEDEPLYVTEGMMDALALMQCGYKYVISVPNGAGSNMEAFSKYRKLIEQKFKYIVFAGDTDTVGLELAERFCKYFATMDVCRVSWSLTDVCYKDANEMLLNCGSRAVCDCIGEAEHFAGDDIKLAGDNDDALDKLYDNGIPEGLKIGLDGFDDIIHLQPGNLLLVTGYPGSGKSTFVNYIVMRMLLRYEWRTLFFSPEKQPQEFHEAEMISILTGKDFGHAYVPRDEYCRAKSFIRGRISFLSEDVSDPDFIISLAHRAVRCYGINIMVIDPFVYLDQPTVPGASESQKIAEVLKKLMFATRKLNIFVILVAHPRKPSVDAPAVEPSLYEVAGSANFYNFCDAGIIMERLKSGDNLVKITCGKARRPYNGALGECQIAYDVTCGRYSPCILEKGRYTTEYRAYDRDSWVSVGSKKKDEDEDDKDDDEDDKDKDDDDKDDKDKDADAVQQTLDFGESPDDDSVPKIYIDPGEQE